jgi:excisionase family DNA binding protein
MPTPLAELEQRFTDYPGAKAVTKLSESTLARLVRDGRLRVHRIGRRVLFAVQDLHDLLSAAAE